MQTIIHQYQPLIHLISCALNQCRPDDRVLREIDFAVLKKQSDFHGVSAMAALAILSADDGQGSIPAPIIRDCKEIYFRSVRNSVLLDREVAHVCSALAEAHIEHALLKGSVLSHRYPKPGMREMCDVDMLIDDSMTAQARDVMESLGYTVERYNMDHHDVYVKEPFLCFELHNKLFSDVYADYLHYFLNCREKLLPTGGNEYEKRFSDDDFYLFQIAHSCKHLHKSGIGLRVLTDLFVIRRRFDLHREYIECEAAKLGITKDEQLLTSLAEKLFSHPKQPQLPSFSAEEENVLAFMLKSGANGTLEQQISNQLPESIYSGNTDFSASKMRYIRRRIFPDPESYKTSHPFFYRHKAARPLLPFVRLRDSFIYRKGKLRNELRTLRAFSNKNKQ